MVTSAKSSVPTVTDQAAAMQLGQCAKNLATCLAELRTSAQKVDPRKPLHHQHAKTNLKRSNNNELRFKHSFLLQAHEACGPMEIDSALTAVQTLRSELQDAKLAAANAQLKPLPGESVRDLSQPGLCDLSHLV